MNSEMSQIRRAVPAFALCLLHAGTPNGNARKV
jgi:hypothetical protein